MDPIGFEFLELLCIYGGWSRTNSIVIGALYGPIVPTMDDK
jgi:hypothetical protein